jgi:hypothetical protein
MIFLNKKVLLLKKLKKLYFNLNKKQSKIINNLLNGPQKKYMTYIPIELFFGPITLKESKPFMPTLKMKPLKSETHSFHVQSSEDFIN